MNILQSFVLSTYTLILALLPLTKYTEGLVGQPQSFLPNQAKSNSDQTVSTLIYRGLFKHDIYGTTVPDLAETWTVSPDGLTYTIKLKDKQHWSNGARITADDLLYTSYKVTDLSGVATDKVDDLTVRYTLPNKYAPFLSLLTVGVMPNNAQEKMNPLKPVTSGDFRVARVENAGRHIKQVVLISTNKDFDIKKLVFRYYANEEELEIAARLGEIDGFTSREEVKLENAKDYKFPIQGVYYGIYFNLLKEKLQDISLRKKLAQVLPIDDLIYEKGILVQGPISRSLFTYKDITYELYDEKIREDLGSIDLTVKIPDTATYKEMATQIKKLWEDRLGINVNIIKVPADKFVEEVINKRDFEVLLYGQEVGRDPDRYVLWHSTQKEFPGLNFTGSEQVRADRALEEGRKELDNEKRVVHYREFQKAFMEQTPAIFLYHPFVHYNVTKYIEGIGEKYTFTYADRFLDFTNWKRIRTN